jgi:hypothetical protein
MRTILKVLVVVAVLAVPVAAFAQGEVLYVIDDKVGIGTAAPAAKFTLAAGNMLMDNNRYIQFKLTGGSVASIFWLDTSNDVNFASPTGRLFNLREGPTVRLNIYQGRVGIGVVFATHPLQMASGAHVTAGGAWTNASSRKYKQDVAALSPVAATETLSALEPVTFAYKVDPTEKHVGFIAEDVPALVATGDRTGLSPMDIVAVLTKVVQEQQKTIAELQARVAQLETK